MGKVTRLTGGEHDDGSQGLHLREPSGEGAPRESVGQDLRSARLSRGEQLTDVSHVLRIGKSYLEALESDCPDRLPGRTYAIGFLRAYANYLGLDSPALLSRYKLATAGLSESAPQVGPAPEPVGARWSIGRTLWVLIGAALLVFGAYELLRPPISTAPPRSSAPMEARANSGAIGSPLRLENVRSAVPAFTAPPAPIAGADAVPTGQVLGLQNRSARVVLHAQSLAHVLVEGPGGKVYLNRILHPGDVYRVPNMVGLSLTTPNGGAVSLELDGRDMGAAGLTGHITEALSLDPQAIVDRRSPGKPDKVTP